MAGGRKAGRAVEGHRSLNLDGVIIEERDLAA